MADGVTMDKIVIEVTADTKSAEAQLNNLKTTIKSLGGTGKDFQKITNGLSSLNGVKVAPSLGSAVEKLAKSISKLDTSGAENLVSTAKTLTALSKINLSDTFTKQIDSVVTSLNELSKTQIPQQVISALESLGKVKVSTTVANNIVKIGEAAKGLTDVDFTKLRELVSILTELKGIGDVKINLSNSTASANNIKGITEGKDNGQFADVNKQPDGSAAPEIKDDAGEANNEAQKLNGTFVTVGETVRAVNKVISTVRIALSTVETIVRGIAKWFKFSYNIVKGIATAAVKVGKAFSTAMLAPFVAVGKVFSSIKAKITEIVEYAKRMVLRQILRKAINAVTDGLKEGTENLYSWSKNAGTDFSKSMDDIATSMLYFKNSVGAAIAPLVNALAPAIRYVTDAAVDMLNIINQLFAKLTGADTWTKAVRVATEYKTETDKASKATDKLKRSLIGLDQIHALNDNSDSGSSSSSSSDTDTSGMFATEIVKTSEDLTASMDGIWSAFKSAWDDKGEATVESIKTAFTNVKSVVSTIVSTLGEVYKDKNGKQVFSGILGIIKNIADAAGNFASNFQSAWGKPNDKTSNGYTILNNLTEGLASILSAWENITDSMSEWAKDVDLNPIFTALSKLSKVLAGIASNLGDDFKKGWNNILKPMLTWLAEEAAPSAIDLVTAALEALEKVLSPIKDGFKDAWDNTKGLREELGKIAKDSFSGAIAFFQNLRDNLPEDDMKAIKDATSKLVQAFVELGGRALEDVIKKFEEFTSSKGLADLIKSLKQISDALVMVVFGAAEVGQFFVALGKTIVGCFKLIKDLVAFDFSSIPDDFSEMTDSWVKLRKLGTAENATRFYLGEFYDSIQSAVENAGDASISTSSTPTSKTTLPSWAQTTTDASETVVTTVTGNFDKIPAYLGTRTFLSDMKTNSDTAFDKVASSASSKESTTETTLGKIPTCLSGSTFLSDMKTNSDTAFGKVSTSASSASSKAEAALTSIPNCINFTEFGNIVKKNGQTQLTDRVTARANAAKANAETALTDIPKCVNFDKFGSVVKKNAQKQLTDKITGRADAAKTNAKTSLTSIPNCITYKTFGETLKTNAKKQLTDRVTSASNNARKNAKTNLGKIPGYFTSAFTDGASNAADALGDNGDLNEAIVKGTNSSFKSFLNTMIKSINTIFDDIFGKLKDMYDKLKEFTVAGKKPFSWMPSWSIPKIPTFPEAANGGIFSQGQMFIAREAGPELVGRFGNRTGVMNNNQIVESVSVGVENANAQQNILLREQNSLLRQMISRESNVRAYVTTSDIINGLSSANKRSGKSLVPITV